MVGSSRFDWISIKDVDQWYVKVEFAPPTPPNIPKVEAFASNESAMSDCCRFAQTILSWPPIEGVDIDFHLGIEQDDSSRSNRPHTWFILYTDNILWHKLMMMKDLQPKLLRWYLRLK